MLPSLVQQDYCICICTICVSVDVCIFHSCVCVLMQKALQEAQEDLAVTQLILDDANEKLAQVEEGIATLQAKYHDCLAKRDELDNKCQLCENRLVRADKVREREMGTKLLHCLLFAVLD